MKLLIHSMLQCVNKNQRLIDGGVLFFFFKTYYSRQIEKVSSIKQNVDLSFNQLICFSANRQIIFAWSSMIEIEREAITEEKFRVVNGYDPQHKETIFGHLTRRVRGITQRDIQNRLQLTFCPFFISLRGYTTKSFFCDLLSGLTVTSIRLPQGLAYGALANVPPIYGLYTELFSCIIYSLLGTSRHISVGTFAIISLMCGSLVDDKGLGIRNFPVFTRAYRMSHYQTFCFQLTLFYVD